MQITINYNIIKYNDEHIIYKLFNLIVKNLYLLKVMANLYILTSEKNKIDKKCNEYQQTLKRVIRTNVMSGYITEEIGEKFIEYWNNISNEDLGRVLEQIIANLGPYTYERDNQIAFDKSMQVGIVETRKKNDFDVVFFDKKFSEKYKYGQYIKICDFVEFHECKKNVCTYIPINTEKSLKKSVENKLDFMKATYDLDKTNKVYIPTFFPIVEPQKEFLIKFQNGKYAFIEILSIIDLYEKYSI